MFIAEAKIISADSAGRKFYFTIENSGLTPAYSLSVEIEQGFASNSSGHLNIKDPKTRSRIDALGPNKGSYLTYGYIPHSATMNLVENKFGYFLGVTIQYVDAFKSRQSQNLRFRLMQDSNVNYVLSPCAVN